MKNIKIHPVYIDYGADEDGNVYRLRKSKWIRCILSTTQYGYQNVGIKEKGGKVAVHHFVWECFNNKVIEWSNRKEGMTIDHIDNNKKNNKIENLRIMTHSDNTHRNNKSTGKKGWCITKWGNRYRLYNHNFNDGYKRIKAIGIFNSIEECHIAIEEIEIVSKITKIVWR